MKEEEFLSSLSEMARKNLYRFEHFRSMVPLGLFSDGSVATAHREEKPNRYHYLLITGEERVEYLCRLSVWLSHIYDEGEAQFLILSPSQSLKELSRLGFFAPYFSSKEDFDGVIEFVKGYCMEKNPRVKLFLLLEGLEEILAPKEISEPYLEIKEALDGYDVQILSAFPLEKSKFFAFPGVVVGIGNGLLSLKGDGKADLTYVEGDSSLGVPREISYPNEGDFKERKYE